MKHIHVQTSNEVFLYERKYLGDGKYMQRGIAKGIAPGDEWTSFTDPKMTMIVESITSVADSLGKFIDKSFGEKALFTGVFVDTSYTKENYKPLRRI
jgi:hypothetical protein